MKKYFPYILILMVIVGVTFPTHYASAWALWKPEIFPSPSDFITGSLAYIVEGILGLMSWILWFAGTILNFVLDKTVVNMSDRLSGLDGINVAWKVVRDLMNIAFIFILVYEGIMLILNIGSLQSLKNFIFGVVLASLLINFSLFFTKVLIDASNVVTIGIYNSIVKQPAVLPNGGVGPVAGGSKNYGLSDKIMQSLGLQSLYNGQDATVPDGSISNIMIMGLGTGIIILVASFVFFAISVMFIIRYLTIIFLLMLSPVAYMGMALPVMRPYAKQWWDSLKGQLLFAPIFMIMILVILTLMTSQGFVAQYNYTDILKNSGKAPDFDAMNLLLNYVVIIGLLIASLVTAKSLASQGSKHIGNATKSLTAFAGGVFAGGAGAIGRRTFGAAAEARANNEDLKKRAAEGGRWAQLQLKTARSVAGSSFDARRSAIGESISEATGVSLGKGSSGIPFMGNAKAGEGGFKKAKEENEKKEKAYIESLKPNEDTEKAYKAQAKSDASRILSSRETLKKYENMDEETRRAYLSEHPEEIKTNMQAEEDANRMKELEKKDEETRKKYYEEHPEEELEFTKKRESAEEAVRKAKAEEDEIRSRIQNKETESKARIDKLTADLKIAETAAKFGTTPAETAALENAKKALAEEKSRKDAIDEELKQDKKALETKVSTRKKSEETLTATVRAEKDKRMAILSEEHQALVLDSQEKGQTLYQKRGEAYAKSLETPIYSPSRIWRSGQINKAAASAVRKAVKEKKSQQKLEDILKEYAKENNATEAATTKTEVPVPSEPVTDSTV